MRFARLSTQPLLPDITHKKININIIKEQVLEESAKIFHIDIEKYG
jgi:hypothetical protein